MRRLLFFAIALLLAMPSGAVKKPRFKPMVIPGLEERPGYWQVRPNEIIDICKGVRNGRAEVVAKTPLGYPVYAVFFGDFSEPAPQTNWSAGGSSSTMASYIGDAPDSVQTIMMIAGVHGSEPEPVAAAVNIIKLLDTGKDLRGKEDKEFTSLASKYRFIIMPCVNMDGRAISPDHLRGQSYDVLRTACQGTFKDGTIIGWKGSKEYFPLPLDKVSYPGGYPNSKGYNIQHDATPGDMRTDEAKAVCRLMARWRVDFMLNCHSNGYQPFLIYPSNVETPAHRERATYLARTANKAMFDAGLRKTPRTSEKTSNTLNLTNLTEWCSGGLGMTLECPQSFDNARNPSKLYTFEQMMEPVFIVMKIVMEDGMRAPLAGRE